MKSMIARIFVVLIAAAAFSNTSYAQGLAERRAAKAYEETTFKQFQTEIQAAAGFPVPVSVNWANLSVPGEAERYSEDEFWTNIYFKPLRMALAAVAQDDMGKSALKAKLKEVSVTYDEATAPASNYAAGVSFTNGKLSINFKPWSNADDVELRSKAIQKVVEENL